MDLFQLSEEPFSVPAPHSFTLGSERVYCITKDGAPYLTVETDPTFHETCLPACIWNDMLFVADNSYIHIIQLDTLSHTQIEIRFGYLCRFHPTDDLLLCATESQVFALDTQLQRRWETPNIACDGVLFHGQDADGNIVLSCCQDPYPAVWTEYLLDPRTGRITALSPAD